MDEEWYDSLGAELEGSIGVGRKRLYLEVVFVTDGVPH